MLKSEWTLKIKLINCFAVKFPDSLFKKTMLNLVLNTAWDEGIDILDGGGEFSIDGVREWSLRGGFNILLITF